MDTIGDPLNPVYVNERGVTVKSSLNTNNLKGKVALGTNADGTFKAASLAISTDSPSTSYDNTKLATKGYVDKLQPSSEKWIFEDLNGNKTEKTVLIK